MDRNGKDVNSLLSLADSKSWESDISDQQIRNNFMGEIEVDFQKPEIARDGSIIITAINTEFSQVIFKNVFDFLGDQSFAFMSAVENDLELINALHNWIDESSLKVSVWNGNEWKPIVAIKPEATAVQSPRVEYIKKLIQNRSLFLAAIYFEWDQIRKAN